MKIVLAPDSFKENMTAPEAVQAMQHGVHDVYPDAETVMVPMSDGGEGFVDAVTAAWGAGLVTASTVDALGRPIRAAYGLDGDRAVMDVASCAGLELIDPADRDVLRSNTAGLGLLIKDAVGRGARTIVLGIGGSATNDAGLGMLTALGARLLDDAGDPVAPYPDQFGRIAAIDLAGLLPELARTRFQVACDVTNPLTGPAGATAVFGPQKGVARESVPVLDRALAHVARVSGHEPEAAVPGAGAAGGLGFALRVFLGAVLEPGVELVAHAVGLADAVAGADLVLTGEGSVDAQTLAGKTPAGVARVAAGAGVPCVVFAGRIKDGAENLLEHGVRELVKVGPPDEPLAQALRHGQENLRRAVGDYLRR
ncbi:glycerate kinase [Actinomyces ruminicola]|uniref:Glycerate kinase n=1 Tax=Actinomyces ruminicola TaxID=332524 RepID=A0A1H0BZE3_9ACTO|nr:glycerate kinase [Actinomyces ruminicola]SDN50979.1 glycerate kinase [Actinomyces ruminicola]